VIRVAILSFWHVHAKDYARQAEANASTQVAAVWDEDAERGRHEAQARGVPFHEDLGGLLASPDIDAVVVTTPTNAHRDVMVAAAQAGKHIFTEKVLALIPADCREILDAVEFGSELVISTQVIGFQRVIARRRSVIRRASSEMPRLSSSRSSARRRSSATTSWRPSRTRRLPSRRPSRPRLGVKPSPNLRQPVL